MPSETKSVLPKVAERTPGEWTVFHDGPAGVAYIRPSDAPFGEKEIAVCYRDNKANHDLIAAAPELLLSCMELREACAACFRVIAHRSETVGEMEEEFERIGLKEAFGVRAQGAITKATKGE